MFPQRPMLFPQRPTSRAGRLAALLLILTVFLLPISGKMAAQTAPKLTLEPDAVTVTGVTPGGSVAWVLLTHQRAGYYPITRYGVEILSDEDADGELRIDFTDGVPAMAVFLAVDLTTGLTSWGSQGGPETRVKDLPSDALARGPTGDLDTLTKEGSLYHAVWIRPGSEPGVWQSLVDDGGEADEDGAADGMIHLAVDRLQPVGPIGALPPKKGVPGDLVVLIEPRGFEVSILTISTTPDLGGH